MKRLAFGVALGSVLLSLAVEAWLLMRPFDKGGSIFWALGGAGWFLLSLREAAFRYGRMRSA